MYIQLEKNTLIYLASVVQRLDIAIHRVNLYPVDSAISLPNTYPLKRLNNLDQEQKMCMAKKTN